MLYISVIILLFLLIFHYDYRCHESYRLSWYLIVLLLFILISGLRYRLGTDSTVYEASFRNLPTLLELSDYNFESSRYGVGYIFLNAVARSLSDSFVILQLLHAIFINTIIFYFFYKNTKHIFTALLLYFLLAYTNYNFEVLRESCAIAVFLIAWKFFKTNSWIKYYVCVLIAISFHISAIILMLLPIFEIPYIRSFFKFGWKFFFMVGIVLFLSAILSVYFFDWIKIIEISTVDDYANIYENSDYAESISVNIRGQIFYFIKILVYPVFFISLFSGTRYFYSDIPMTRETRYKLEYMFCWFVYISIISMFIRIFYRFGNYFLPFWIIILSDVFFSIIKYRKKKVRTSFVFWCFILLPFLALNTSDYFRGDTGSDIPMIRRYYPYASVLNPQKDKTREKLFIHIQFKDL